MVGVLQQVMQPIPVPKVRSGHGPEGRAGPGLPVRRGSTNPYYKIH